MTQIGVYTTNPLAYTPPYGLPLTSYRHLMGSQTVSYTKRVPNCQKCGQHGRKSRLKGHKRVCPYRDCNCAKCQVVSERQKLMADQIKIRRRQRKDTLMNITRENITATLNAAAVVAAAGPLPYLNNINALLYKQLQQNMQPAASFLTSPSPTGSGTESNSYSPTSSLNCFTPSPPDLLKAAVSAQTPVTAVPTSLGQLPLLFQTPAVSGVSACLPSAVPGVSLADPLPTTPTATGNTPIAMPVAINPLLSGAACSSSAAVASNLPSVIDNEQLFQSLLANVRLLEQKMCAVEKQQRDEAASSAFVDVCSM